MLRFALVLLTPVVQPAQAPTLPVDGPYGARGGCEIHARYGMAGVVAAGGTDALSESRDDAGEAIIVTPDYVAGCDWVCEPGTVDGRYAALVCVTEGATWMPMPIAAFERAGRSLHFSMDDEPPVMLQPCDRLTGG